MRKLLALLPVALLAVAACGGGGGSDDEADTCPDFMGMTIDEVEEAIGRPADEVDSENYGPATAVHAWRFEDSEIAVNATGWPTPNNVVDWYYHPDADTALTAERPPCPFPANDRSR